MESTSVMMKVCPLCGGSGNINNSYMDMMGNVVNETIICPMCLGTGEVIDHSLAFDYNQSNRIDYTL